MEKIPLSGSEQKKEEYVSRYFDMGEPVESHNLGPDFEKSVKEAVLDRYKKIESLMKHPKNIEYAKRLVDGENIKLEELPENMRYAVRYLFKEMSSLKDIQKNEAIKDLEGLSIENLKQNIPLRYRNLPAEIIEDIWSEPIRVDDQTGGRAFQERKAYILKFLKKDDLEQSDLNKIEELRQQLKGEPSQEESVEDPDIQTPETKVSNVENSKNLDEVELKQKIELDPNLDRASNQEIFGDSNGSYTSFIEHLQSRNLIQINEKGELLWTGENTRVTFLGDILGDRTSEGEKIYIQLMNLKRQAEMKGGTVTWLAGNHENMYNSVLFGFETEKGSSVESDMENRLTNYTGNLEPAHFLSSETLAEYFNQEGISETIQELLGDTSELHKIIKKKKDIYAKLLQNKDIDPMKLESYGASINDLENVLSNFKNSFTDPAQSYQVKIDSFIALGSYLPNYALVRLGRLILDSRQEILETIKEKNPDLLEGIYEQKLVNIQDDTLCCHTNFTKNMMTLIESHMSQEVTFTEAVEKLNKYYQSILRWHGSDEPRNPENLSDSDIKYFNSIRDEFISTSSSSRINYSENIKLDDSDKVEITQRLKNYGINIIVHGHNDENGEVNGLDSLPILSVDRSAYKGSEGVSSRPIATASLNTKGELSYF